MLSEVSKQTYTAITNHQNKIHAAPADTYIYKNYILKLKVIGSYIKIYFTSVFFVVFLVF